MAAPHRHGQVAARDTRSAIQHPRSIDLALLVVAISAACTAGYLTTPVGQLAGLDQQVRQLESFGVVVTDETYAQLRRLAPYRPAVSAGSGSSSDGRWRGWRSPGSSSGSAIGQERDASYAQVLAVVVHASAILAVRSLVAMPINFARESLGGATSLSLVMPAFGESTFPARLVGALDLFLLWWVALMAMGLGKLYGHRRYRLRGGCSARMQPARSRWPWLKRCEEASRCRGRRRS